VNSRIGQEKNIVMDTARSISWPKTVNRRCNFLLECHKVKQQGDEDILNEIHSSFIEKEIEKFKDKFTRYRFLYDEDQIIGNLRNKKDTQLNILMSKVEYIGIDCTDFEAEKRLKTLKAEKLMLNEELKSCYNVVETATLGRNDIETFQKSKFANDNGNETRTISNYYI
jgi:hypothetical protein